MEHINRIIKIYNNENATVKIKHKDAYKLVLREKVKRKIESGNSET